MPRGEKSKGVKRGVEVRLIELIREKPELYDPDHHHYRDNNQRKITWENISKEMNIPVGSLKKLWKKLLHDYAKKSRDVEVQKTPKSTPSDETLTFLMASGMEYADENSCENVVSTRRSRSSSSSSSHLTSISEEDRSTVTLVPEDVSNPGDSGRPLPGTFSLENSGASRTSDRVLRPRHSEPSRFASRESLGPAVDGRRLTATSTTPSTRGKNRKLILDPGHSTQVFFDAMAVAVSNFPQHLQAVVKLEICKIVAETECDLSSPKNS